MLTFDEFKKIDIRVGEILSAEKVPETDKLLKLIVDLGEENPRQIISGISSYFPDLNELINKKCMFVVNLEPRTIRELESNGMLLAILDTDKNFSLLVPDKNTQNGSRVN